MIILIRLFVLLYILGVVVLLINRASKNVKDTKGLLAIFLFPLMILTKEGRKNLKKGNEQYTNKKNWRDSEIELDTDFFMLENSMYKIKPNEFEEAQITLKQMTTNHFEEDDEERLEITETGLYKTRDGRKVFVSKVESERLIGIINGEEYTTTWFPNGILNFFEQDGLDIVSKWKD